MLSCSMLDVASSLRFVRALAGAPRIVGRWVRAQGDGARHGCSPAWRTDDRDATVERTEAIAHVHQTGARAQFGGVEARAVVRDLEGQLVCALFQGDTDSRRWSAVLCRVLDRLETAVVDGGFERRRVAADLGGADGKCRARRRPDSFERLEEAVVAQDGWVEAV